MTVAKLKIKPDCRDRKLFPQVLKKQFKIRNIENFGLKTRFLFSYWQSQQWYQKTEILAIVFFGRQSSGIEKPKFWQWFFRQNSSGIKEPKLLQWFFFGRHSSGIKTSKFWQFFFFFADIAVVSKNRNYGNGFFLSVFHGLSLKH